MVGKGQWLASVRREKSITEIKNASTLIRSYDIDWLNGNRPSQMIFDLICGNGLSVALACS